jgi:zinc protease
MKVLNKITKKELDAIAQERLKMGEMVIVVVGDEANNIEGLRKLGYEIIKLNAKGEPVETESMESGK